MESVENPVIDVAFSPLIKLLTGDRCLNLLNEFKKTRARRILEKTLDVLAVKIEKRLDITAELRKCLFGTKGMVNKRSALVYLLNPILGTNLRAWKKRQENRARVPRTIHKTGKLPQVWRGWKKLRDEVCPNFSATVDLGDGEIVKILPHDTISPKERINGLVEFKDVDRVGFGFTLTHATSFIGAQPSHGIGGLWQAAFGQGTKMAKAAINTWIRLGGIDWGPPISMTPMAMPVPETHSPFYYKWMPPTDTHYEQFIEKELFTMYEQIHDWGLTSFAQEVTKSVVYQALVGLRETVKAMMGISKYFGSKFMSMFESYAGSIFAIADIIPMARGMIPFMKDLRKRPDEIIQIFEFLEPGLTELAIAIGKITKAKYILLGNSRGSSSWVSPRMFEDIFWPTQKKFWMTVVKAGFKVCAHLDNDWTDHMEYMLELPKHSGFFHLDQGDLPRVRDIIGDHFCLMGNLSPAVTCGSGPDVVYKETKRLIEACGKDGGYIVSTGCEAPANIPVENYFAVKRAIRDHGYYKR